MPSESVQLMTSIFGSATGSAVAGYLGVKFGLTRFKGEKAFERQLDWLERTLKNLYDLRNMNIAMLSLSQTQPPHYAEMAKIQERYAKAFDDLEHLTKRGE